MTVIAFYQEEVPGFTRLQDTFLDKHVEYDENGVGTAYESEDEYYYYEFEDLESFSNFIAAVQTQLGKTEINLYSVPTDTVADAWYIYEALPEAP